MATNHVRIPQRRSLAQRAKADENAMSRHLRQASQNTAGPLRLATKENAVKTGVVRQALGEVTMAAVNRKDAGLKPATGKEKEEIGLKRGRSDSTSCAQRVPLGPGRAPAAAPVANPVNARVAVARARASYAATRRASRVSTSISQPIVVPTQDEVDVVKDLPQSEMDIEDDPSDDQEDEVEVANEREVENMIGVEHSDEEEDEEEPAQESKHPRIWPEIGTERALRYAKELQAIRETFHDEVDMYDTTMVSEYAEEIFEYMCDLEEEAMPQPDYMSNQTEITWEMRQTLVDWLLQVHFRYHMLPETLWIAINVVDRFLSRRVVSLGKLQLVGVTAMFIAAKYEEILAPSVEEFVFMTENGYTKEEILKGERIVLQTLEFRVSHYCSPYSWMRKISKADDYDIQTRTLSKFLTEVTLLDHRFLKVKPSLIAAIGMYCARKMLGGDWNEAFVFYSGFTEEQLLPGHQLLVEKLAESGFSKQYVCKKYANKKFLKASVFAIDWAKQHVNDLAPAETMMIVD
ncbi:A/B/D/E cyclin [Macrolepiota fuliginosa MF-IS2]|uniref:A/B/D/E cyclin n=1 Tax=Macrolepiota fuliginosa MF-IS2 TaxID=1400762 RepID=A0A9P5XH94_9AGAR|nr:A/B/D/E cyclin [Macrolepiota fuliginosa MF-IS2]